MEQLVDALNRQRRALNVLAAAVAALVVVQLGLLAWPLLALKLTSAATKDPAPVEKNRTVTATREKGDPAKVHYGYGIVGNESTSLVRERVTIRDSAMPVEFVGSPTLTVGYDDRQYIYTGKAKVKAREAITALEFRIVTFDVFGQHGTTLSSAEMLELKAGEEKDVDGKWGTYDANEATMFLHSVAFIARVRLADGRVVETDQKGVLEEFRKISTTISPDDLAPPKARDQK